MDINKYDLVLLRGHSNHDVAMVIEDPILLNDRRQTKIKILQSGLILDDYDLENLFKLVIKR